MRFLALALLFVSQSVFAGVNHPKTIAELKETSVRIMNLEMNSGGTGSIFRSFSNASHILTNKHVCHLIEQGGVVDYKGKQYLVTHYKKFPDHDLCLVRVAVNLGVNLEVAEEIAAESSPSIVSGHPNLLPHIASIGHLSERMVIQLMVGIRECTDEDFEADPLACMFLGGMPIIKSLESRVVSNLIKPGSSGSAVFNKRGQLVGVVFAGASREFSYGFIVPQEYLIQFIRSAPNLRWVAVGTPVDDEGVSGRVFNFNSSSCDDPKNELALKSKIVKNVCENVKNHMIWSK